jgi:hypothetical protein
MLIKPKPNLHQPLDDGRTHPSISLDRLYVVASESTECFRVVDEDGEPILVPRFLFDIVDDWIPNDWIRREDRDEDWYSCGPPECEIRGFFERWHDGDAGAREVFGKVYLRLWQHYEEQLGGQGLVLKR